MLARYVWRDLVRNPRRSLAALAGIALGVGLFSAVLFFIDGSSASMTQRAVAPLPIDMQRVLTAPLGGRLHLTESVEPPDRSHPGSRSSCTWSSSTTAPARPTRWSSARSHRPGWRTSPARRGAGRSGRGRRDRQPVRPGCGQDRAQRGDGPAGRHGDRVVRGRGAHAVAVNDGLGVPDVVLEPGDRLAGAGQRSGAARPARSWPARSPRSTASPRPTSCPSSTCRPGRCRRRAPAARGRAPLRLRRRVRAAARRHPILWTARSRPRPR